MLSLQQLAKESVRTYSGREYEAGAGFEVTVRTVTEADARGWTERGFERLQAEHRALLDACSASGHTEQMRALAARRAQVRGVTLLWNAHVDTTRARLAILRHESTSESATWTRRWNAVKNRTDEGGEATRAAFLVEERSVRESLMTDFGAELRRLAILRRELAVHLWRLEQEVDRDDARLDVSTQRFRLFDLATGYAVNPTLTLGVVHGVTAEESDAHGWYRGKVGGTLLNMDALYEPDVQGLVEGLKEEPLPEVVALRAVELGADGRYYEVRGDLGHERPFYVELQFASDAGVDQLVVELESTLEARPVVLLRVGRGLYRSAVLFLEPAVEIR